MTSLTNDIIFEHEYSMVRAELGVDEDTIADADIESLACLFYVEAAVKEIITDWAILLVAADKNTVYLKTGVIKWVAARLCGKLLKSEAGGVRIGDYAETGDKVEWGGRARQLAKEAAGALARISTRTTLVRPTVMVLAGPTRSGATVPTDYEAWLERIQPRLLDWVEEGGQEDDSYYGI